MSTVTVRVFAVLRERLGCDTVEVEPLPGETVGALYQRLFPPGPHGALPVAFARNRAYVDAATPIDAGDEVAFLPPLGGG